MNKNFKNREIRLLRHQLLFLGAVPLHPEACSGLRLKLEGIRFGGNTATDLRIY